MTTINEIVEYANNLIKNQDIIGFCLERDEGRQVAIRLSGQFFKAQIEHLLNKYPELTNYWIEDFGGFMEIVYEYLEQ